MKSVNSFGSHVASCYHSSIRIRVKSPQLGVSNSSGEFLEGYSERLPLAGARSVGHNGIKGRLGLSNGGVNWDEIEVNRQARVEVKKPERESKNQQLC